MNKSSSPLLGTRVTQTAQGSPLGRFAFLVARSPRRFNRHERVGVAGLHPREVVALQPGLLELEHSGFGDKERGVRAQEHSLDADRAYLAWAREIQARNCGGKIAPLTPRYKNAITANDKAGPAKRQVVNLWKPIANTHGLPTYVWNRL